MHIHDSYLLPHPIKILTFTWGAHLLSLHLWGFFKSELRRAEICVFYTGVLRVPRFTAAFTYTHCSPGATVAAPALWSGILSVQAQAIHLSCVQVASRSCFPSLCNSQNNLGYSNIPSMCAHGKVDLWELPSKNSQDHKTMPKEAQRVLQGIWKHLSVWWSLTTNCIFHFCIICFRATSKEKTSSNLLLDNISNCRVLV